MGGLLFDCKARSSNRQLCFNERPARFVQDLSLRDHSLGNPALPTDMNSLDQSTICLDILQRTSNQHYQQPTTVTSLAHRTRDPTPIDRDRFQSNRTAHPADPTQILPGKIQNFSAKSPQHPIVFYLTVTTLSSTNTTLAGVAQSVERVALITAKRSTSRSWVRAPPSAIPITSSSEQLFFCRS